MLERHLALLALVAGLSLLSPAPGAAQDYRTVAIVGDTQVHVGGGRDAEYADFTAMIDWIIANKDTENIDFVLQVGDMTNLGLWMPLPPSCDGAPALPSWRCNDGGQCIDPLPAGCWQTTPNWCASCASARSTVASEWERFDAQFSRLEPDLETGWTGVPYALVRGNHDNVGASPATDTEIAGYNQYYSEQRFQALEQAFAGSDRHFEHLETYPSEDRDGHVWRFRLGEQDVIVVGPSVWPSRTQRQWVQDVLARYPQTPAILLSHDMIERNPLKVEVVDQMPVVAPQLFMTVQGHISRDQKSIVDIAGYQVLKTVNDWSYAPVKSYMTLVRFYFEPAGVDAVEALTYSPALDEFNQLSTNYVELQAFGIDQDPDHDGIINPLDEYPTIYAGRTGESCGLGMELAPLLLLIGAWRARGPRAVLGG